MNWPKPSNKPQPPRLADKLLEWFCAPHLLEELQGDLHEEFVYQVGLIGKSRARFRYWGDVIGFIRPFAIKRKSKSYSTTSFLSISMLSNHFKLAFRNLLRNKVQSLINISGLALGIACCLIVFLIIRYELSFDSFHSKADRIYRVNTKFITSGGFAKGAPLPIGEALKRDFPEVEQATTIDFAHERLLKVEEQLRKQKGVVYAAPEYFTIIDTKWLSGDPRTALAEPNSVVLTRTTALNLFGGKDNTIAQLAIGKTFLYEAAHTLKVTGVVEDFPSNTDLPFELFISYISLKIHAPYLNFNDWISFSGSYTHFLLLSEGADVADLQRKIPAFEKKYMGDVEAGRRTHLLQPLREMHFDDRFGNYNGRVVSKENIGGLILIGLFILLTACINFINLSTAQSIKRAKEVGVRKVLGANRMGLVRQFLAEMSLLTFASVILAAIITILVLPGLKELLGLQINFNPFKDPVLLLFLIGIAIFVSILAGLYPAFILSGFQPIQALKNKLTTPRSNTFTLRRSLIVLQFTIAQVLIICSLVVSSQLEYFRSKPLGFAKDAIITIGFPSENKPETSRALRNQLLQLPGVEKVSYASYAPSSESSTWSNYTFKGADPTKEYYFQDFQIDHTYLETYDLTLLAGKNLDLTTDSSKILVNEKLLQTLNISNPEDAIGYALHWNGQDRQIAGVVKDFHATSVKNEIPSVVMYRGKWAGMAGIKISPANLRKTVAQIEELWKKTYPNSLVEYSFLDETVANFYREEVKLFKLFRLFSAIAIFISCLGVYGLVSFMALQRNREIGVRKVLGASAASIVLLFSKEFLVLILIAFSIAAPLAWYAMNSWIEDFHSSLPIGPASFLTAILFSLFIAGITVAYRSMRAAMSNPVKSLRSE